MKTGFKALLNLEDDLFFANFTGFFLCIFSSFVGLLLLLYSSLVEFCIEPDSYEAFHLCFLVSLLISV